MLRIKKGDKVRVISGSDRGVEGVVERVYPKLNKALILGVGMYKKHVSAKKSRDGKGGVFELPRPIDISKISLLDPKSGKPTKVGFTLSGDKKLRVARSSKQLIDTK